MLDSDEDDDDGDDPDIEPAAQPANDFDVEMPGGLCVHRSLLAGVCEDVGAQYSCGGQDQNAAAEVEERAEAEGQGGSR